MSYGKTVQELIDMYKGLTPHLIDALGIWGEFPIKGNEHVEVMSYKTSKTDLYMYTA